MGPAIVDNGSGLQVQDGDWILGATPLFYFNVPGLLGATKENPEGSQVHLYTSLGVGYLRMGSEQSVMGIIGGGLLWESGVSWFGIRVDLKSLFYKLENSGGSDFNADLALTLSPSFLF